MSLAPKSQYSKLKAGTQNESRSDLVVALSLFQWEVPIPEVTTKSERRAVTIRDVAKESGFASATVSIVLNKAPLSRYIPETTKKRVERAAKKLGYRPNVFARTLRNQRTQTVGVMVFDMTDPYCIPILRGIETTLYEASFLPILTDVHNERSRFERYLGMLLDRRVEALILVANWLFVDVDVLGDLEKSNVPTAMIGRELKAGSVSSVTTAPRWKGVRSFAAANRLEIDPELVVDLPESSDPLSSFDAGFALTTELIRKGSPFTALMAFDDMTAFGAVRALHKAGIRVPEQCSVIGFDDISHSSFLTPSLTTVRQPMPEMGQMAVNIVADNINALQQQGKISAIHRKLVPQLITRESTGKANSQ